MNSAVLTNDLSMDRLSKRLVLNRRTVQVLMLMSLYGELTTGDIASMLDVSVKTLRDRHLPRLVDHHWIRGERLVSNGPATERWKMGVVQRKRAEVFYNAAERDVLARLQKFKHLHHPIDPNRTVKLGTMD
jgi:predicted ArsR family transcriptional regulator